MKLFAQILFLSFFLSSCGFTVIYKEEAEGTYSYEKELASIRIQKARGRDTQELRDALKDVLNPELLKVDPKYILVLDMTRGISGTFITSTGASGRNKVTITVEYTLISVQLKKVVAKGNTLVNDNYDVQDNRYGTYVAEDYVAANLTKVAAQNIRNLLVNDIIEIKKKEERGESIEYIPPVVIDPNADEPRKKKKSKDKDGETSSPAVSPTPIDGLPQN